MSREIEEHIASESDFRTVVDAAGFVVALNLRLAQALGQPPAEIVGHYFWDYVDASTLAASLEVLDDVSIRNIDRPHFVNCLRSQNGEPIWIEWQVKRIRSDGMIFCRGVPASAPS